MNDFSALTRSRIVPLEGAYNMRDLGGLPAAGGKTVKRGLLFRSDEWNALTANDKALLEGLSIRSVVDFRGAREAKRSPDIVPCTQEKRFGLSVDYADMNVLLGEEHEQNRAKATMTAIYREMPRHAQPQLRAFVAAVGDAANLPLAFHCTAGKDRTGVAALLLLSALGVARDLVFEDYMLSAALIEPKFREMVRKDPASEPLVTVYPEYFDAVMETLESDYGGAENYLANTLGVDVELLCALFLE